MPQGDGLGFISQDLQDLFRPLDGAHVLKDPNELKPEYRARKCASEVPEELIPIPEKFWGVDSRNLVLTKDLPKRCPTGVLIIKVRLADDEVAIADIVRGPYMKWAIVESICEAIFEVSGVQFVAKEQIVFCMEEVKIIDIQMPYNGTKVWQFCEFRFDYVVDTKNEQDAETAVSWAWQEMAAFERVFCKALESKFRDIYHLTVLNLVDKRHALMDGQPLFSGKELFEAACRNDVEAIDALLKAGVDVNWKPKECAFPTTLVDPDFRMLWVVLGRSALLGAAEEGHVEAMRTLLDAKADVNFQDNSGFHALYLGAGAEDAEKVVKFLLAWGASVNLKNKSGYTPLHNACGCGEAGAIKALLEARADLNIRSSLGSAPVHVAVLNNQPGALDALAGLRANLDMPAFGGNTPLHEAIMQNSPPMIRKLVDLKANINVESGPEHQYATPLKMARDRKRKKVVKLLESLGALESIEGHDYEDLETEFEKDSAGNFVKRVTGREVPRAAGYDPVAPPESTRSTT